MRRPGWLLVLACCIAMTAATHATPPVAASRALADAPQAEQRLLERLLAAEHWPMRVFAMMRLERYRAADAIPLITPRLRDESPAARCFAIDLLCRRGATITAADLDGETDARVVRTALWHGIEQPSDEVEKGARRLLATPALDELLLGLEIAAACPGERLRDQAERRAGRLINQMDDAVAVRITRRLVRILDVPRAPVDAAEWRLWLESRAGRPLLRASVRHQPPGGERVVANLEPAAFDRLIKYLDDLRRRRLELAIVMDATTSMLPMIDGTRAGVESLILFLGDISREFRLAFVAYRDHDNPPIWEGHPFATDVDSVRDFLFRLPITGGADLPEAVLDGLTACRKLDWSGEATREIVLVGDAEPHADDDYKIARLLEAFADAEILVHAIHVPMEASPSYLARLHPTRADAYLAEIDEHNRRTASDFASIARLGGGDVVELRDVEQLVPSIMHLTLQEAWWPAFDEFYWRYLTLYR